MGMKKMRRKSFNHDIRGMLELTPSEGGDHEIERIVELHNKLWPDEPKLIKLITTWRSDKKKRIEFLLKTGFTQLDYLDQEIPKRVWVTYQKVT